jgi:hypothetical protein
MLDTFRRQVLLPRCCVLPGSGAEVDDGLGEAVVGVTRSGQTVQCPCDLEAEQAQPGRGERGTVAYGFVVAGCGF